ncbi:hypothetical protein GA0061098_103422 [Bradyrhizobium shewense]|uniref:Uncharacterized protein n=1 Tax=Bradyrhizobium shewense TaxID=1761772 RepID=A0A1C3XS06_9BRAD|nr:hypothetical protein [Bradyrhizobium shewense]SCB55048.1 hypothetical protein GA0061098_103422 [Bradyrhizobium shewense]
MLQVGWLTVAGLVADIAGASVLAWDILPEYCIYRWRAQNKLFHAPSSEFTSEIEQLRQRPEDPFQGLAMDMRYLSPLGFLRHAVGLSQLDFVKSSEDPQAMLRASEKEVTAAIDAAALRLHDRWRPPLRTGILLIVVGFIFQLLGQLGSMGLV